MAEGSSSFARSGSVYLILITSYHSKACRYLQSGQIGPESRTEVHSPARPAAKKAQAGRLRPKA